MYVIKAGNLYLHRVSKHTYDLVSKRHKAIKYPEETHCHNIISTLPDTLLPCGEKWIIVDAELDIPISSGAPIEKVTETQSITPEQAPEPETPSTSSFDLLNITTQLVELYQSNYGTQLFGELNTIEQQLCDMYHYIEFHDLNVCDGYRAYKALQTILKERRVCKDNLKLLTALKDNCNFEQISAVKNELTDRHYSPRQLTSLFE